MDTTLDNATLDNITNNTTGNLDAQTKVICVTGSGRRIGAGVVRHMHALGYRVIIHCYTSIEAAEVLAKELNGKRAGTAAIVRGDLNDIAHFGRLAEDILACFGRLDVLVHNASRFYPTNFTRASFEQWDELFISNAKAPYFLTQALLPALKESKGSVVSLLDIHADDKPFIGYSIYNMAKAAHRMLVKSLSLELAPEVRVNGIAPGANIWPDAASDQAITQQTQRQIESAIPLERIGNPGDIAQAAAYLAEATYVTGHVLNVDGGRSLTMAGG